MTTNAHQELALRLREAYTGGAIPPLREWLDPADAAGAYAVQAINTRYWESQGRRIVGSKAGLTAEAVQKQLGVDQPDFGMLFDDMQVADGGRLNPSRCIQPKAEAEIAFVLGTDLPSPDTTVEQVTAAVARVHAAIEIVDSRTREVVASLKPGPAVLHMEFAPRGAEVWVSVRDANQVRIYDAASFKQKIELPVANPSGIFFTARAARRLAGCSAACPASPPTSCPRASS